MEIAHYIQPDIFLWGLRIQEPITTITDLMVTAVCLYAFIKLAKIPVQSKTHLYVKYYFLSMSIATFFGGVFGHGFLYMFDFTWNMPEGFNNFVASIFGEKNVNDSAYPLKLPGWITSMFAVMLLERAIIEYARKLISRPLGTFFGWVNIIELLIFMTITFTTLSFYFVEIHTAYGLLFVVGSFSTFVYIKTRSQGSKIFMIAVGISATAALFFMNQWGFGPWFNHLDASHTLMTIGAFVYYKGSLKMIEETKNANYKKGRLI
ncbi:MAG: hypothetical protein HOD63_05645 [Bacteroidetes bacterium]|jgi:hypothetical protein|nr:hypothetical protein [Bacteroidota bacterium]MBT6837579.1 hypothetical protein [Bacteroidota bacterium]